MINNQTTWAISWITSTAHSLKHTPSNFKHQPIDSPLLAKEMTKLFFDKVKIREGDILKINPSNINENKVYLEVFSQTTDIINNQTTTTYKEIGADIEKNGICKVEHYLEHKDKNKFIKAKEKLKKSKYSITVKFNDVFK